MPFPFANDVYESRFKSTLYGQEMILTTHWKATADGGDANREISYATFDNAIRGVILSPLRNLTAAQVSYYAHEVQVVTPDRESYSRFLLGPLAGLASGTALTPTTSIAITRASRGAGRPCVGNLHISGLATSQVNGADWQPTAITLAGDLGLACTNPVTDANGLTWQAIIGKIADPTFGWRYCNQVRVGPHVGTERLRRGGRGI